VIDHPVAQQRPVLHQSEHFFPSAGIATRYSGWTPSLEGARHDAPRVTYFAWVH